MKARILKALSKITPYPRVLFWIIASFAILVLVWEAGFHIGIRYPEACAVCHYEKPYYDQWKTSTHNDISCYKCHPMSQGEFLLIGLKYFSGNYQMRPRAEVHDASCLASDCHAEMDINEQVTFKADINFNHKRHLGTLPRGQKLHCTSCHSQIVQGEHIAVTEATCFLCHFKEEQTGQSITGCSSCHGTPTKLIDHDGFVFSHDSYLKLGVACNQCHVRIKEGNGDVSTDRCYSCHIERLEEFDNTKFIHSTHVRNNMIDCEACHDAIRHGNVEMISTLEVGCENCHSSLHYFQKEMYIGSGARGTENKPSRMFTAQLSCDGCHTHLIDSHKPVSLEKSYEGARQSCVDCHGANYDLMLDDWAKNMKKMVTDFQTPYRNAERAYQGIVKSGKNTPRTDKLWNDIQYNYEYVKQGRGEHNVEYAVNVIKSAVQMVDTLLRENNPKARPVRLGALIDTEDGYCTILCHTRLGVPEELQFEHMDFPHALHHDALEIACTNCHSPDRHKMRIITKSECMNCHHDEAQIGCNVCHKYQSELYYGKVAEYPDAEPDIMAMAEIDCQGCHDLSAEGTTLELVEEQCVACHEDGYQEMLTEWYKELQEERVNTLLLLDQAREYLEDASSQIPDRQEKENQLAKAEKLLNIIEEGRAIHNPELSRLIYSDVKEQLESLKK